MHFSYCMHLISGDRPWIQPATLFTKVNSSVKTGELLRCRRLFEARGLEVHWVLPKGRHEVSARRPRWWITDVAILGIKHHNFNGGYIHGACAQKRYHKVMLIEDISGTLPKQFLHHLVMTTNITNGLAIGRACHFPICSRTWPPSVAWHFPNAQWVPNLHENYGPPGLLASPGHGKGLWSLCFVPCWTWTPPSANSPPSPTVAAGRKKILIYGESMTILMGWWFSPLGSRRTPLDPTWWEAQVAMANCNSFRSVVRFCSRLGNESEIWDV